MVGVMMMSVMMMPVMRRVRKAGAGKKQHRGGKSKDLDHDSYPTLQNGCTRTRSIALRAACGECHLRQIGAPGSPSNFNRISTRVFQATRGLFDKASEAVSYKPVQQHVGMHGVHG
jgi:hypothetical protein